LPGVDVTPTSLLGLENLDAEAMTNLIANLDARHSSMNWWIGDLTLEHLIRSRSGDRSLAGVPMLSDQPANARATKVALAFPPERRRASLSWTHHLHVHHLDDANADRLLAIAEDEGMSAHALAALVRQERDDLAPPLDGELSRRAPLPKRRQVLSVFAAHPHGGYVASFDDPDRLIPLDADAVARLRDAMGGQS